MLLCVTLLLKQYNFFKPTMLKPINNIRLQIGNFLGVKVALRKLDNSTSQ